ncbi:MAG TPA: efflux RND transporter periplasmic adaptor subunit [Candidatus Binataceae bacterium]|nr:efflux RND transporter periplasmic adaptor subunit [Candidatus Binataceae bacterium]
MKARRWYLPLVVMAAALMAGCNGSSASGENQPARVAPLLVHQGDGRTLLRLPPETWPQLSVGEVRVTNLPGVLQTTGQVSFDDRHVANIISRVSGRIEDVRVSLWDHVTRGEAILTLYSPDIMTAEAEYLQARAAMAALGGGAANRQFAESMVEAARRKLDLLGVEPAQIASIRSASPSFVLHAPIAGTVVQNLATRGAAVNPGDTLYSLGTLDHVWITADIFEDEVARVAVGQTLEAVTTAYPAEVFRGRVERISPVVDPNTHTLQIRCEVDNPGDKLKPQMLAQVRIIVRPGTAVVAPREALVFETDSYFAYVDLGRGLVERRKVTIAGWGDEGQARIVSGLRPGERVVTTQALQVDELWNQAQGENS